MCPQICMSKCTSCRHSSHLLPSFFQGAVISPSMDPSVSLQPSSIMAPLTQQMGHLSLGSAGTVRYHDMGFKKNQNKINHLSSLESKLLESAPLTGFVFVSL